MSLCTCVEDYSLGTKLWEHIIDRTGPYLKRNSMPVRRRNNQETVLGHAQSASHICSCADLDEQLNDIPRFVTIEGNVVFRFCLLLEYRTGT